MESRIAPDVEMKRGLNAYHALPRIQFRGYRLSHKGLTTGTPLPDPEPSHGGDVGDGLQLRFAADPDLATIHGDPKTLDVSNIRASASATIGQNLEHGRGESRHRGAQVLFTTSSSST